MDKEYRYIDIDTVATEKTVVTFPSIVSRSILVDLYRPNLFSTNVLTTECFKPDCGQNLWIDISFFNIF